MSDRKIEREILKERRQRKPPLGENSSKKKSIYLKHVLGAQGECRSQHLGDVVAACERTLRQRDRKI